MTCFYIVKRQVRIGNIGNLLECFLCATHLKGVFSLYDKITFIT